MTLASINKQSELLTHTYKHELPHPQPQSTGWRTQSAQRKIHRLCGCSNVYVLQISNDERIPFHVLTWTTLTHTHTHTHTLFWLPSQDETSPVKRISSSAMVDYWFWWSRYLIRHSPHQCVWDHVKGFYCSPAEWLWSLLLSFSLFEPYVWPDFSLPIYFFLCGDWDYDVIYSCWSSHARSLRYLPHFPAEETSSGICYVSDAGELTKIFN